VIADDFPGMASLFKRILTPDCEVVEMVADGRAAIDAAARLEPDVMLVDLNLPNVSGLEVCRHIARASPDVKLIVVTGSPDQVIEQLALAAGASAFISKTAAGEALLPAIRKALAVSEA
jgi:DNA-binding NarL/FixJ family response regulator